MSASSFLYSSFLQAITAVMLWPVHVQKVPQASERKNNGESVRGRERTVFKQSVVGLVSGITFERSQRQAGALPSQLNCI